MWPSTVILGIPGSHSDIQEFPELFYPNRCQNFKTHVVLKFQEEKILRGLTLIINKEFSLFIFCKEKWMSRGRRFHFWECEYCAVISWKIYRLQTKKNIYNRIFVSYIQLWPLSLCCSLFFLCFIFIVENLCVYLGSVPQSVSHLLMHVVTMLACRLAFERSFSMICNFREFKLPKLATKDTILYKTKCYKRICCGFWHESRGNSDSFSTSLFVPGWFFSKWAWMTVCPSSAAMCTSPPQSV